MSSKFTVTYLAVCWGTLPTDSLLPNLTSAAVPCQASSLLFTLLSAGELCPQTHCYLTSHLLRYLVKHFTVTYLSVCWGTLPTSSLLLTPVSAGYFAHKFTVTHPIICWGTLPSSSLYLFLRSAKSFPLSAHSTLVCYTK